MIDYVTFAFAETATPATRAPIVRRCDAMLTFAELGCWPIETQVQHVVVMYVRRHPAVPLQKTREFRRLFGRW